MFAFAFLTKNPEVAPNDAIKSKRNRSQKNFSYEKTDYMEYGHGR